MNDNSSHAIILIQLKYNKVAILKKTILIVSNNYKNDDDDDDDILFNKTLWSSTAGVIMHP